MKRLPFRVEMARAWHEGRKTVTRRIVKPQPLNGFDLFDFKDGTFSEIGEDFEGPRRFAPYAPGSTVIIAEPLFNLDRIVFYAADEHYRIRIGTGRKWEWKVNRLSGRYMPNWAARSWARIVSVRVERLQEITEADAERESFQPYSIGGSRITAVGAFAEYIDKVNGPGSWQANPWVFRYELEKLNERPVIP